MQRILLMTINPGLSIVGNLATAQPAIAYFAQLSGYGGISPYRWEISAGSLPSGIFGSVDSSGDFVFTGTTSEVGSFAFTVTLRDAEGRSVRRSFVLTVQAEPLVISGDAPSGQVGVPYSYTYAVEGGLPSYSYSIASGTLPSGLSLNVSTGEISGTPTAGGSSSFRVRVTDSQSPPAITDLDDSISIAYATLVVAGAWTGVDVGQPLGGSPRAITGGLAPYSVSLLSGTQPDGVTISVSGSNLVASGNTTTVASYAWTDRVTSADGQHVDVAASLSIAPSFPLLLDELPQSFSTSATTKLVQMPAAVNAGDLLIVVTYSIHASGGTITAPPGWTSVSTIALAFNNSRGYVFFKVADGSEGGTTVDFATASTSVGTYIAYRYAAGTHGGSIAVAWQNNGHSGVNWPAPALTPSWPVGNTGWIRTAFSTSALAVVTWPLPNGHISTFDTTPSNRALHTCRGGSAVATLAAANFALSGTAPQAIRNTIAIKPA